MTSFRKRELFQCMGWFWMWGRARHLCWWGDELSDKYSSFIFCNSEWLFYHHTPAGDHLCGTQGGPWLVFYSVQGREQNMSKKVEKKKRKRTERRGVGGTHSTHRPNSHRRLPSPGLRGDRTQNVYVLVLYVVPVRLSCVLGPPQTFVSPG